MKPTDRDVEMAREARNHGSPWITHMAELLAQVREEGRLLGLEQAAKEVEDHVTNRDVSETGAAIRFHLTAAATCIRALGKVEP